MKKSIHHNKGVFSYAVLVILILGTSCKTTRAIEESESEKAMENKVISAEAYSEKIPETEITMEMIKIPAGNFVMGSPASEAGRKADEGPQREVSVDAFWMGKHEITWDIFELFFKQNKVLFQNLKAEKLQGLDAITRPSPPYEDPSYGMGKDGFPAVSMSTYSALVFCKWLSNLTGKFYRLPTEAEWEYAARAGTATAYSFGDHLDELDKYAVHYKNSGNKYAQVGSKLPNAWGLYDMHGNVSEWTLDQYKEDAYAKLDTKNPWAVPTVIHPRVYRGGSWDDDAHKLRSASRTASSLKQQKRDPQIPKSFWWFTDSNFVGFRIVSPVEQPSAEDQKKFWQMVLDE